MNLFEPYKEIVRSVQPMGVSGRVRAVRGLTVSATDFPAPVGAVCRIEGGSYAVEGRVVGFDGKQTLVMPTGSMTGIGRGDRVELVSTVQAVALGEAMLGRVLNGLGQPIDGGGAFEVDARAEIFPRPLAHTERRRIDRALCTGVRAIDATLTVGRGQRMGVFAPSGVGKSVLMGMLARHAEADVAVVALVGERGREVGEFLESHLGSEGRRRSVVVVATSDEPPLLRVQAGAVATALAEFFRDRGRNVLLLMDSLTRLAAAQRQIGLVAGEPPATRGYTPSVFSLLPELLERCGRTESGSITGFYTVLAEGDMNTDPICDAVRAVTDGHIVLSADLAARGQYPAVDVVHSISRVMGDVADVPHRAAAMEVRRLLGLHAEIEQIANIGAYQAGASGDHDLALRLAPAIRALLAQKIEEVCGFEETKRRLVRLHHQALAERRKLTLRATPAVH